MVEPIYRALGGTALLQGVENRLVQAGRLVTAKGAEVILLERQRAEKILWGLIPHSAAKVFEKEENFRQRAEFDFARQANGAIQRLMQRNAADHDLLKLAGGDNLLSTSAMTEYTVYQSRWLSSGARGESFCADDLIFSEDMYLREDIEGTQNMRIPGIPLNPMFTRKPNVMRETVAKVGLWQISETMEDWADNICTELKSRRLDLNRILRYGDVQPIFWKNREWVSDDSLLVDYASEIAKKRTSISLMLLSADKRLARVMARTTGLPVVMLTPLEALKLAPGVDWKSRTEISVHDFFPNCPTDMRLFEEAPAIYDEILIDTGNVKGFLTQLVKDPSPGNKSRVTYLSRIVTSSGIDRSGHRFEVSRNKRIEIPEVHFLRVTFPNGVERMLPTSKESVADQPRRRFSRIRAGLKRFSKSK
jgi:hypothetical protein